VTLSLVIVPSATSSASLASTRFSVELKSMIWPGPTSALAAMIRSSVSVTLSPTWRCEYGSLMPSAGTAAAEPGVGAAEPGVGAAEPSGVGVGVGAAAEPGAGAAGAGLAGASDFFLSQPTAASDRHETSVRASFMASVVPRGRSLPGAPRGIPAGARARHQYV
jgi:hypothetical protein